MLLPGAVTAWTCLFLTRVSAQTGLQVTNDFPDDKDLANYVTRPDIRPPNLEIKIHNRDRVAPGYLFVSAYEELGIPPHTTSWYPAQVGPQIYDQDGQLVWSGSAEFPAAITTHDLKSTRLSNGSYALSVIAGPSIGTEDRRNAHGSFRVYDDRYNLVAKFGPNNSSINLHELRLVDNVRHAIYIVFKNVHVVETDPQTNFSYNGTVASDGFREVDIESGKILFEWYTSDHVRVRESTKSPPIVSGGVWDSFHINSVDKTSEGDYIISVRHTDAIYKVSAKDGSLIWKLGGVSSSFALDNFNFSRQHDAHVVEEHGSTTIISFLNNAGDPTESTSSSSEGLLVSLNTATNPMTAKLLQRYPRPDGGLSVRRGSMQILPNSNALVGWSENGLTSEFTSDGELVLEASWATHRFVNYRSYKLDWVAYPSEPPAAKAFIYGLSASTATTVVYVSWNGATEVDSWNFWGGCNADESANGFSLLSTARRTGFETMHQIQGAVTYIVAEAIARDGMSLGNSSKIASNFPSNSDRIPCTFRSTAFHDVGSSLSGSLPEQSWRTRVEFLEIALGLGLLVILSTIFAAFLWRAILPRIFSPSRFRGLHK